MSVLLPNATLGVRRRIDTPGRNAYGERLAAGWGEVVGPHDGRTNERADGGWNLGVDPACWPIRQGDLVVGLDGGSWLVETADLVQNNYDSRVDWVRITAQRRTAGGTLPGGAWFVARYLPTLDPEPPQDPDAPYLREPGLWVGHGPPPAYDFGARPGDEYLDLSTGTVYHLGGEP